MPESGVDIQELKNEIKLLKEEKARLDKMKSRLFSIVSHDIKSPLGILVGFADVLMRHVDDNYDTKEDVQIQQIKGFLNDGKNKILALLENLVNWVKIENGSVPYRATEVKIGALIEQVKTELAPESAKKELKVNVICQEDVTCFGDSNTFKVILKNLLDNAIKYSNSKGHIDFVVKLEDSNTTIALEDRGVGMSDELLVLVFEANKEKIKPGTGGEQGIGLGLPVVDGFVKLNQGTVSIESEEGSGTIVKLTFPKNAPEEATA